MNEVGDAYVGKQDLRMDSPPVLTRRRAGVVAHPASLPGNQSQGTLGGEARRFVDWCTEARIGVWQVLPLGPTHQDRSPYQCQSVLAGNPELIDRSEPMASAWPTDPALPVAAWLRQARHAFEAGADEATRRAYDQYVQAQAGWLDDFALFRALRAAHNGLPWWEWRHHLRHEKPVLCYAPERVAPIGLPMNSLVSSCLTISGRSYADTRGTTMLNCLVMRRSSWL